MPQQTGQPADASRPLPSLDAGPKGRSVREIRSWHSLKTRMVLFTLVIVLAGIWSLALYTSRTLHDDMQRSIGEQQLSTVALLASNLNAVLEALFGSLNAEAANLPAALLEDPAALQRFLEDRPVLQSLFNGGTFVTEAQGTAVASLPLALGRTGVNFLERAHVAAALHQGKAGMSDPVIGKKMNTPVVSMAVPVRDRQGRVIGALVGVIDLSRPSFLDQFTDHAFGKTGGYFLVDPRHRLIITATNKRRVLTALPAEGVIPAMDRIAQGFEGTSLYVNHLGQEVLASSRRVPAADWIIHASLPAAEAFAPVKAQQQRVLLAALALTLLMGTLTWWMLRRLLAPMLDAARALTGMSAPDQPLQPLPVTRRDEVGQLIRGFNGVLETLAARESALKESETKFHSLYAAMTEGVALYELVFDAAGRPVDYVVVDVNPAFLSILGVARASVIGRKASAVYGEVPELARYAQVARTGQSCRMDVRYARQGRDFSISVFSPAKNQFATVFSDITERKRAEAAMREARDLLKLVVESVPVRIFWKDRDLRYLGCNTLFARDAGCASPGDLIGRDDFELGWKGQAARYRADDQAVLDTGLAQLDYDEPQTTPDGKTLWLRSSKVPLSDDAGQVMGVLGLYQDVTDSRRAQDQLRKLVLAVEQSPESIAITNVNAEIEYINEAFSRTTGYSPQELVGINPRVLQSGKTPPETYTAMWSTLTRGQPWKGEFINRRKDGSEYIERATIAPVRQPDGQVTHYVAIKEDITERKQIDEELARHRFHLEELVASRTLDLSIAKEAAESANRAKSAFLANMSHELRTPMNGIMGMTDLALRRASDPKQREQLLKVTEASRHLLTVINDVLDIARLEANRTTLELQPFGLTGLVEEVADLLRPQAADKGLALRCDVAPALAGLRLLGDPLRLRQILLNLAGNAIKFTASGSVTLTVSLAEADARDVLLRLEVRDTGIGISEADQRNLFAPFHQVESSLTRRYGGAGLGLALSRQLAQAMGGSIGVQSQPGAGSTFWFTARLARVAPEVAVAAQPPAGDATPDAAEHALRRQFAGARILLAEDEPINQEVGRFLLEEVGLSVDVADDGAQALEKARAGDYALILMDMQLPVLNGLDATRAIRALPGRDTVPIVAVTANAFDQDREQCLDAGMNDFIAKPVEPAVLYATVLHWLQRRATAGAQA